MNVEAQTIRVPTGLQDYRPALYGGIAAVELDVDGIHRVAARRGPGRAAAAASCSATPASRATRAPTTGRSPRRHIDGDPYIFDCFERIRDTAVAMRGGVDTRRLGRRRARPSPREWENRKRLAPGVTTPAIDDLIARAMARRRHGRPRCAGRVAADASSASARRTRRDAIRAALAGGGARLLDFQFERHGLTRG